MSRVSDGCPVVSNCCIVASDGFISIKWLSSGIRCLSRASDGCPVVSNVCDGVLVTSDDCLVESDGCMVV